MNACFCRVLWIGLSISTITKNIKIITYSAIPQEQFPLKMLNFSCFMVQFEIGKEEAATQFTAVAS